MSGETKARELGAFARVDDTDADDFIDRLDRMQTLDAFKAYKLKSFDELRLGPKGKVADIGCGAGDDAAFLADQLPAGQVTGVDLSASMVAEASKRFAEVPNLAFAQASAEQLPFESGSLDAIRADRVLIHVENPSRAMSEMIRVLKPGGRIVLTEPDMNSSFGATDFQEVSQAIARAIASSCLHPFLPRDMAVMLKDAGMQDVQHSAVAMVSQDFTTINTALQFEVVVQGLKKAGVIPEEMLHSWWQDQVQRVEQGRFMAGLNIFSAVATKP